MAESAFQSVVIGVHYRLIDEKPMVPLPQLIGRIGGMGPSEVVLFLHGLGDGPAAWDAVIVYLPAGVESVTLRTAIDSPQQVRSLTLVAGQVKLSKVHLLAAMNAAKTVDFISSLASVRMPTLVLFGSRDQANLPAAHRLVQEIPTAQLSIIADGEHTLNRSSPELLAQELGSFITG